MSSHFSPQVYLVHFKVFSSLKVFLGKLMPGLFYYLLFCCLEWDLALFMSSIVVSRGAGAVL